MNVKFSPNLFLEVVELERFKQSLDEKGFRKNIIENSESYGLIHNIKNDPSFTNGKVTADIDTPGGDKAIQINELFGIDQFGRFLYSETLEQIAIPSDGNWYWVKITHAYNTAEKGLFSIDVNGNLVGDGNAELETIFRGMPNFPTRIKFIGSAENTLEYDVLEVINNQNAVLQHPALTIGGDSEFVPETDLRIQIVGTFTPGVVVPTSDKYIFQYDGITLQLAVETVLNTPPTFTTDTDFHLARVRVDNNTLVIQDKRVQHWETKGSQRQRNLDRTENALIGVESIKYTDQYTTKDENLVHLSWGMRSSNWSVDSSSNILTLNSGVGGKFKETDDFTNGDFDGWRLYTSNGKFARVVSSVKQGMAINLTLDVLDVDNYSNDGGQTWNTEQVLVVPDSEEILVRCTPVGDKSIRASEFSFPINQSIGILNLAILSSVSSQYIVEYRYKSFKDYTDWVLIPDDEDNGYYDESSYDSNGILETELGDRNQVIYTNGIVTLTQSPESYYNFQRSIDKGDLIGVETRTTISSPTKFIVGTQKNYQHFIGTLSLTEDTYLELDKENSIEGNEFRFHFECDNITLDGYKIYIVQSSLSSIVDVVKKIDVGDVFMMKNIEGGIIITCKYNGVEWIASQNYELGPPGEIITLDGVINDLFNGSSLGKVRGLYGYALCDGLQPFVPDLRQRFLVGAGNNPLFSEIDTYAEGDVGGVNKVTLTISQMPEHSHSYAMRDDDNSTDDDSGYPETGNALGTPRDGETNSTGSTESHENRPPYYAVIYAKKLF